MLPKILLNKSPGAVNLETLARKTIRAMQCWQKLFLPNKWSLNLFRVIIFLSLKSKHLQETVNVLWVSKQLILIFTANFCRKIFDVQKISTRSYNSISRKLVALPLREKKNAFFGHFRKAKLNGRLYKSLLKRRKL